MIKDTVGVVPAAGLGTRLGLGPKAFLSIGGYSLLGRVINTLSDCVDRIVVGVPSDYVDKCRSELAGLAEVYAGGMSRQTTIFNLFKQCSEQIIVIHDISRPFASKALIRKIIDSAKRYGAAAPFIPTLIPVARYVGDYITASIPATEVMLPQAPQAFQRDILDRAYDNAAKNGIEDQTTSELILRLGEKIFKVPGEESNIKITTPLDWEIANKIILQLITSNEAKSGAI